MKQVSPGEYSASSEVVGRRRSRTVSIPCSFSARTASASPPSTVNPASSRSNTSLVDEMVSAVVVMYKPVMLQLVEKVIV